MAREDKAPYGCDGCAYLESWLDIQYGEVTNWQYGCELSRDGRCRPDCPKREDEEGR